MKLFACAIRDKQVDAFLPVFFVRAKGEAMRHFIDLFGSNTERFTRHPGDYDLFCLAEFDDQNGEFKPVPLERMMSGLDAMSTKSAEV